MVSRPVQGFLFKSFALKARKFQRSLSGFSFGHIFFEDILNQTPHRKERENFADFIYLRKKLSFSIENSIYFNIAIFILQEIFLLFWQKHSKYTDSISKKNLEKTSLEQKYREKMYFSSQIRGQVHGQIHGQIRGKGYCRNPSPSEFRYFFADI